MQAHKIIKLSPRRIRQANLCFGLLGWAAANTHTHNFSHSSSMNVCSLTQRAATPSRKAATQLLLGTNMGRDSLQKPCAIWPPLASLPMRLPLHSARRENKCSSELCFSSARLRASFRSLPQPATRFKFRLHPPASNHQFN